MEWLGKKEKTEKKPTTYFSIVTLNTKAYILFFFLTSVFIVFSLEEKSNHAGGPYIRMLLVYLLICYFWSFSILFDFFFNINFLKVFKHFINFYTIALWLTGVSDTNDFTQAWIGKWFTFNWKQTEKVLNLIFNVNNSVMEGSKWTRACIFTHDTKLWEHTWTFWYQVRAHFHLWLLLLPDNQRCYYNSICISTKCFSTDLRKDRSS